MTSNASQTVSEEAIGRAKAAMREAMLKKRENLAETEPTAADQVRDQILTSLTDISVCVAGYVPIGAELDLTPTLDALHELGFSLCLPVNEKELGPLTFRAWAPGRDLVSGPFGTRVPPPTEEHQSPDVLLVPLTAFDGTGHRLGYGKGFYDRTLYDLRERKSIAAYGIAFDGQEVEAVPCGPHDQRLDGIFTPTRIIDLKEAG